MTDEARHAGPTYPNELTRRLTEHLCVWCGTKLPDNSPSDLFERPECQSYWHEDRNQRKTTNHAPLNRNEYGHYSPLDVRAEGEPPNWLGNSHPAPTTPAPTPPPPPAATADLPPGVELPERYDYVHLGAITHAVRREPRPGRHASRPEPTDQADQLGESVVDDALALEEIGPEPEARTPFPTTAVRILQDQGWHLIRGGEDLPKPVQPIWHCDRCDADAIPHVVTTLYPYHDQERNHFAYTLGTRTCCSHCRTPYPGPTIAAMYRPHPGMVYDIATVRDNGYSNPVGGWVMQTHRVGVQIADTPPLHTVNLWEGLRRDVRRGYPCHTPGCGQRAHQWYLLGAPLAIAGWLWRPTDNEALRIGLCKAHNYQLRGLVVNDPQAVRRMIVPVRDNLKAKPRPALPRLRIS